MKKYYITNEIVKYNLKIENLDIIYFEMPSFCSGEYYTKIFQDEVGFYINVSEKGYFKGCRDFEILKPSHEMYKEIENN